MGRSYIRSGLADYDMINSLLERGLGWDDIGAAFGQSDTAVYRRYQRYLDRLARGAPLHVKKRDEARDYIRIYDLRVVAGLPWHKVAPVVDMTAKGVCQYFERLQKIYGSHS